MFLAETKKCLGCGTIKPVTDFSKRSATRGGRQSRCKPCAAAVNREHRRRNPEAYREGQRERYRRRVETDPEFRKREAQRTRLGQYGLTQEQYEILLDQQEHRCAVCRDPFGDTPHIDHCHETGRVRGVLCGPCNKALGHLRDDPARAEAAAAYLRRWSPSS